MEEAVPETTHYYIILFFVHPFMQKSVAILSSAEMCSLLSHEFQSDMSLGFYLVNVNKQFGERTIRQITASRCILRET